MFQQQKISLLTLKIAPRPVPEQSFIINTFFLLPSRCASSLWIANFLFRRENKHENSWIVYLSRVIPVPLFKLLAARAELIYVEVLCISIRL